MCTFTLLVWIAPAGQHGDVVTWALLVASIVAWVVVLGVHLRDSSLAAINRAIDAAVEQARQVVREELGAVRGDIAAHDQRVGHLAAAIENYGDQRATAAHLRAVQESRVNGDGSTTTMRRVK